MKDYKKLCPKLEKHIPVEIIEADFGPKEPPVQSKAPSLTKEKVETVYAMIKEGKSASKIRIATGLQYKQVVAIFKEIQAYKNWTEPEPEEV